MPKHLKIIPLLIVVAMLAFSVRLVEVVTGVRHIAGAAYAEDANSGEEAQPEVTTRTAESGKVVRDTADTETLSFSGSSEDDSNDGSNSLLLDTDPPTSRWVDASDSDLDASSVSMEMFEDMAERRKELDRRENNLVTREALLRAAEQELERKYKEMAALRTEIKALLEQQSEEEQARIDSLVKIYEGMKAKDAARIFDTLDLDVLVNVMSKMSERKIAPILAAMQPERARSVTIMLAEQKSLPELPQN